MAKKNTTGLDKVPKRLFLDSSVLQVLLTYGEFIYDGGTIPSQARIWSIPKGLENLDALKQIMFVGNRALFEFALSSQSLEEVAQRKDAKYMDWARDVLVYWRNKLASYDEVGIPAFSGYGSKVATKLESKKFGYLSNKDKALLVDALKLECEAFITMDRRLVRNTFHLEAHVAIKVLEPIKFWGLLQPWAPLFV